MKTYYLHDGTNQLGPFTYDQMKEQKLTNTTPVWFDGLSSWTTIGDVPELRFLISTPPSFDNMPPPENTFYGTSTEALQTNTSNKKNSRLLIITGASLVTVIILFFLYQSSTQAAAIESVQQQQELAITEKNEKEVERQRINEELSIKNMNYRNNWSRYIQVTNSNYSASNFGGISNLKVVVINETDYLLDEVIADVAYIKANGSTYQTIQIPVNNIPAHSRRSVEVDDSGRGTSVEVSARNIMSKKMHFYFSNEYNSGNNEDPYFFKAE